MDHSHETLQMPKKRPKLDAKIVADFTEWINRGAPDPRTKAPEDSITPTWSDLLQVRKHWWSFQPITSPAIPAGKSASPIDRFLNAKIAAAGITPSAQADKATLIRRATYVLTGLPPSPVEIAAFEADTSPDAFAKVVDRLLASPRYGEHFARHWMDLVRYADSSGSEGDPEIIQAWRYRDYLIRAFNTDVPYDQFVREQLAGDLLKKPRVDTKEGVNESRIGPGHFRLIEHGFQPLDTADEQLKNVDNQIDMVSKTFLGLTVSCARCHDHKFDAISQADFYALYGIFASTRPAQVAIDSADRLNQNRAALIATKSQLRTALANEWSAGAQSLPGKLATIETAAAEYRALKAKEQAAEEALSSLEFRARLQTGTSPNGPTPSSWWTFEQDGSDLTGKLPLKLEGGAVIRNGRLILDGEKSYASTAPLAQDLQAKTLEAWVSLSSLEQKGGGVVTVEIVGGSVFDSIVASDGKVGILVGFSGQRRSVVGISNFYFDRADRLSKFKFEGLPVSWLIVKLERFIETLVRKGSCDFPVTNGDDGGRTGFDPTLCGFSIRGLLQICKAGRRLVDRHFLFRSWVGDDRWRNEVIAV
jgi:hypothetical protein